MFNMMTMGKDDLHRAVGDRNEGKDVDDEGGSL
jgi:hypothetical protein